MKTKEDRIEKEGFLRVLIVRDSARSNYAKEEYREYDEEEIYMGVINSNALIDMPNTYFDAVIVDVTQSTMESGDYSFLKGLDNLSYRVSLAMLADCEGFAEAEATLRSKGIDDVMVCSFDKDELRTRMEGLLEARPHRD